MSRYQIANLKGTSQQVTAKVAYITYQNGK
jgi:hypothetical protein